MRQGWGTRRPLRTLGFLSCMEVISLANIKKKYFLKVLKIIFKRVKGKMWNLELIIEMIMNSLWQQHFHSQLNYSGPSLKGTSAGVFHLLWQAVMSSSGWGFTEPSELTKVRGVSIKGLWESKRKREIGNLPEHIGGHWKPYSSKWETELKCFHWMG